MAYIEEANELMTDATGQSIATAIGNMSATSVGNLSALTTTDKTSLVGAVNEVKSGLINPVSGTVVVTLPANSVYGFYYFLFPSTAFAFGKTVTISSANFVRDSTELKDYISAESYNPTEIGRIYKISNSDITGVSSATYGNPLLITYTVA